MPIIVVCSSCGKRLKAKETMAGRKVACPGCGQILTVNPSEEDAAALLLDQESRPQEEEAAHEEEPAPAPVAPKPAPRSPAPRIEPTERKKPAIEVSKMQPLTSHETRGWLRHLHWLLVLALIPLAMSLLATRPEKHFFQRLLDEAPPGTIERMLEGKLSLDDAIRSLPEHRLHGAFLPRDTWMHWGITLSAALLFFIFLAALTTEGSASAGHVLAIGLFTATIGIGFLLAVQWIAAWADGVIIIPRSLVAIFFYVLKFIGYSYNAALDPENGFLLSFMGFTLGVGLCEEVCKALPLLHQYHRGTDQTWLGAYMWGLASGAGFGLAESITYSSDFYNGVEGAGIYIVRNISCVALHALWTGSAAITIHQKQHLLQGELAWHDWIVRALAVVAVPMVLHGLYDTLLKKEMTTLALLVAIASFGYLAFQIRQLRGGDDQVAHEEMLREYQRRRKAMTS